MVELERKAWIENPKEFLKILYKKAKFLRKEAKKDSYYIQKFAFDTSLLKKNYDFNSFEKKKIFRIRFSQSGIQINYKQQKFRIYQHDQENRKESYNIEKEIFLSQDTWNFYKNFFKYLNFICFIKKKKYSIIFQFNDLLLEYNKIHNLGYFLEIEYLSSKEDTFDFNQKLLNIYKTFEYFGFKKFENRLYIDLLLEKKIKANLNL